VNFAYQSLIKTRKSTIYEYKEKYGKGKGKIHPRTGHEGTEEE